MANDKDPSVVTGFRVVKTHRSREIGLQLLNILVSQGGVFPPEEWEDWGGKEFVRRRFGNESIEPILDQWQGLRSSSKGISLYRHRPYEVWFLAWLWDYDKFDSFSLNIEKSYLHVPSQLGKFLDVSKSLYQFLRPAYGSIETREMIRTIRSGSVEIVPAPLLQRDGLPDIYWANFFGPEYVEIFGPERVLSAPCQRVERLADGGVLLVLTESPLDFEKNPEQFNQKRDLVRSHLGEDAFFMDYERPASRFPKFRFWDERQKLVQQSLAKMPKAKPAGPKSLKKAGEQLEQLTEISETLRSSAKNSGYSLDYSIGSLNLLEDYVSGDFGRGRSEGFESRIGAYLGLVAQKHFGGLWRVDTVFGVPALDIPKSGQKLPDEFEPFGGRGWPLGYEDIPDVLVDEKLVRIWPFAKAHRLLQSEIRGRDFRAYVDAIQKGLEMKGKTLIRIP